ncbi:MAG: hypothetical protein V2I43_18170, partial [Parvularcula sp.]|nr:hypothetical protein [Parvularcula sp.]
MAVACEALSEQLADGRPLSALVALCQGNRSAYAVLCKAVARHEHAVRVRKAALKTMIPFEIAAEPEPGRSGPPFVWLSVAWVACGDADTARVGHVEAGDGFEMSSGLRSALRLVNDGLKDGLELQAAR